MTRSVLALDIGGANLKAAHSSGTARLQPFELWKQPAALREALAALIRSMPPAESLAVTMTGELCDCFETKRQGVGFILDAVEAVAGARAVRAWRNDGRLVDLAEARASPLQVAAANWLALATFAGRYAPAGTALLIDIGSTTTDIVPLQDGKPVPQGRTDPERLRCDELVYCGARRTPICALLREVVAAELFATTLDAYLVLGRLPEDPSDCHTADGRPATRAAAHARLARMLCEDAETCTVEGVEPFADWAVRQLALGILWAIDVVWKRQPAPPQTLVLAGSGEFVMRDVLEVGAVLGGPALSGVPIVSLADRLGPEVSQAACAYALAVLTQEASDEA